MKRALGMALTLGLAVVAQSAWAAETNQDRSSSQLSQEDQVIQRKSQRSDEVTVGPADQTGSASSSQSSDQSSDQSSGQSAVRADQGSSSQTQQQGSEVYKRKTERSDEITIQPANPSSSDSSATPSDNGQSGASSDQGAHGTPDSSANPDQSSSNPSSSDSDQGSYGGPASPSSSDQSTTPPSESSPGTDQGAYGQPSSTAPAADGCGSSDNQGSSCSSSSSSSNASDGGSYSAPWPGTALTVGGGVFGYSDRTTRNLTTELGAIYDARLTLGDRAPISLEISYIGSAQNIHAAGLSSDARLMSNGVQGNLRLNLGSGPVQPYILGGAAWRHFYVANTSFNTSVFRNTDNVVDFPVGLGFAFHIDRFVLDARADYRFATRDDLIRTESSGPRLDHWTGTLSAGVEF